MSSFFSHGFASGGESTKQGKKKSKGEKEGTWVSVVDGRGQIVNWQHSVTGAYWAPFNPAPVQHVVGGAFAVQPVAQQAFQPVAQQAFQPVAQQAFQPVPQQAFQPVIPWGVNVMPLPPMAVGAIVNGEKKKKEKGKENKGGYWVQCFDKNGARYYKHSRTKKITYTDPYY